MRGVFTCAHVHACAFTNDHERAQSQARIARSFGSSARWRPGHRDLVLKSAKIDACASDREAISMAAAPTGPWDFADNGRRENPTTPSWYSCIIGPGSIFQIVNPLRRRPTRRAETPSFERSQANVPLRCIMARLWPIVNFAMSFPPRRGASSQWNPEH